MHSIDVICMSIVSIEFILVLRFKVNEYDCIRWDAIKLTSRFHHSFLYLPQAFNRIRDEKPEVLKKLVPIQGDVTFAGELAANHKHFR